MKEQPEDVLSELLGASEAVVQHTSDHLIEEYKHKQYTVLHKSQGGIETN